jgi:2',5'-phosphodiesterase
VALSFHRLRSAIKLVVPAERLQRRPGGLLAELDPHASAGGEVGAGLAGDPLAAAAAASVGRGETLLTCAALAAVEVGMQTGRPPRLPPSDQDVAAALCRLQALGLRLDACQVGVPTPGTVGQPSTDRLPPCGADLSHGLELQSAYGVHTNPTHVTTGYANALDWLAFSPGALWLRATAPLPGEAELRRHVALPSVEFSSDHVSLIAELEWRGRGGEDGWLAAE